MKKGILKKIVAITLALAFVTSTPVLARNARPTNQQLETLRLEVRENSQRLRYEMDMMNISQRINFRDNFPDHGITPITQEEIEQLREDYPDRDPWILQETVAELMTYYRAQLGLGPVGANETIQQFAQEHAEAWATALREGTVPMMGAGNTLVHGRPNGDTASDVHRDLRDITSSQYSKRWTSSIGGPRMDINSDTYLPGFVEARAHQLLGYGSVPHFNNWASRPMAAGEYMLVGVGYAQISEGNYLTYIMFAGNLSR